MRRVHFCAGLEESNGMAVVARFLAKEQDAQLLDVRDADYRKIRDVDEVWVHSCWTPEVWRACRIASKEGKSLVRMMHGNLDPVRLGYHSWKKHLVGFIERFFLRQADMVVATCEAEAEWIRKYEPRVKKIEVTDIKRFFELGREFGSDGKIEAWRRGFQPRQLGDQNANSEATLTRQDAASPKGERDSLHILYLGRRHPLKGVEYLEKAVAELNSNLVNSVLSASPRLCVRLVSNAFGEELEKVWNWCDVLVLPTLSDNFGLVIAEALERGKRVITTDGAPAWGEGLSRVERVDRVEGEEGSRVDRVDGGIWSGYGGRLIYLKGYREGTKEQRIELLRRAIELMSVGEMMAVS